MNSFPAAIPLPFGYRAELIPGTRIYTIDGVPTWLDVTIPSDLAASGWFWNGAFLSLQGAKPGACGISICPTTSPPPFWNVARDGRVLVPGQFACCFLVARYLDVAHVEFGAQRIARLAATAMKTKPAPVTRRAAAVQTMMELL